MLESITESKKRIVNKVVALKRKLSWALPVVYCAPKLLLREQVIHTPWRADIVVGER